MSISKKKIELQYRHFLEAGEVLFVEGDPGDAAYFVESGALEVLHGSGDNLVVLAQLGPGEIVGEMALIDSAPRSATVRANFPTELLILDRETLRQKIASSDPLIQLLIHSQLNRLRATSRNAGTTNWESAARREYAPRGMTDIRQTARKGMDREARLRHALATDELQLHYQPIVGLSDGVTVGYEALLRWPKPDGCFHVTRDFIDLAEETVLILEIDKWVFRRACRDAAALKTEDNQPYISVNISGRQFSAIAFLPMLKRIVEESGTDPKRLQIEVTEGKMIESPKQAAETLRVLREMGMKVALDDFGTGFSSLGYLQKLGANVLKIDRSFVFQMRRSAAGAKIIRAITALGKSLDMTIIVEGVENQADADQLRSIGCELAQGFGYSEALPLDEAIKWLGSGPAKITDWQ